MQHCWHRVRGLAGLALVGWALLAGVSVRATDSMIHQAAVTADDFWQQTIDLVQRGDFGAAEEAIQQVKHGGQVTEQLRTWLGEYQAKQHARKEMDRVEFERYVRYARERVERKEWTLALDKVLLAADVTEDREALLQTSWLHGLVDEALMHADKRRQEQDWRGAWDVYWRLAAVYERETRYQELEREALTHLRLETMFKEGRHWEERLEKIRWDDAEEALERIGHFYVEPPDFKKIARSGIEQLLLLAESKAAQEALEGLRDEDDRHDFVVRLQKHLGQVRASPSLDRADCVQHFRRIVLKINQQTVRLPEELLVSELMRGALDPLDDFTTLIWPKEVDDFDKHTRGNFIGVGIQIVKNRAGEVEVVTPLDGTPAYRAGIQAGDVIVAADGVSLTDKSLNKVVEMITGPKGTRITLTIRRQGKEIEFPLARERVKIQSVKGIRRNRDTNERWVHWLDEERGVGYLRVTNFQRNTVEDVETVLHRLRAKGLKGLVLDLRGNPGGLLDSAYRMSSLFLNAGDTVVSTRGRISAENQQLDTISDGPFSDLPLAVLVDESSASASEIVSGAIRDNGRGTVIGARTFGKFSVQNLIPLGHSRTKLKLTTASYHLPSGASLHRTPTSERWGVEPNIPVRLVRWERSNVWRMRREADLLGPPKPEDAKTDTDAESAEGAPPAANPAADSAPTADPTPETPRQADGEGDDQPKPDAPAAGHGPNQEETDKEAKLPPLDQPDENNRPDDDPQLDTALLVLRVSMLATRYPSLPVEQSAGLQSATRLDSSKPAQP